jgi:molybdate transport system regulatory protein
MTNPYPQLKLRILFADGLMLGPGKAQLLELIRDTGSISAAGRAMGMSYKRAWMLVEAMNAGFKAPVVESMRGGSKGGGAALTEIGAQVLQHYRAFEAAATNAGAVHIDALKSLLIDIPPQK